MILPKIDPSAGFADSSLCSGEPISQLLFLIKSGHRRFRQCPETVDGVYLLISKFIFIISLMARASSVMLASPWMVCLMTELATAKLTMSMGL